MGNHIFLQLQLDPLTHFLQKVLEGVDADFAPLREREIAGEFADPDDLANAFYYPMMREEIATKAVLYEVNAIVEWQLCQVASLPFNNSPRYKRTGLSASLVYHRPIDEICSLIEQYYEFKLSSLSVYNEVKRVRDMVNSFKHRQGQKDYRKEHVTKFPDKFELSREDAYKAIETVKTFLRELWKKTGQ